MDHVGCPAGYWLLCTLFVIGLLNHIVNVNGAWPFIDTILFRKGNTLSREQVATCVLRGVSNGGQNTPSIMFEPQ